MKYITIKKHPFKGFYVVDTKVKHSDYCGWNIITAICVLFWYFGLNPKYAFWIPVKLDKLFNKK